MTTKHERAVATILGFHRRLSDATAERMAAAVVRYCNDPASFDWEAEYKDADRARKQAMR